ncbi:MAG: histidine phosphatase family protein [Chloroflexota bacterium]
MKGMVRLLFIRHGQTLWNKELRYNGDTDTVLTALGRRQAAAVAARLQHRHVDAVVCSDRRRATETAEAIVALCRCPVRADARWREVIFGEAEGLRWREVVERFPLAARAWAENRADAAMPGGESVLDVARRVQPALAELAAEFDQRTVAVVSHGGPLRVALCLLLGSDVSYHWRYNVMPCTLSEAAVYPSGGVLNLLNDACHLRSRGPVEADEAEGLA